MVSRPLLPVTVVGLPFRFRTYRIQSDMSLPTRVCQTCGRSFTWRKKWARDWEQVRYCSRSCQKHKPDDMDRQIEQRILDLLNARNPSGSICPSEVARQMDPDDWRNWMERVRQAARRLVARGQVVILQKGAWSIRPIVGVRSGSPGLRDRHEDVLSAPPGHGP